MRLTVVLWLAFAGLCVAADPHPAVVRITNGHGKGNPTEGGSGVVVEAKGGRSLVVTNKHVIDSGGTLYCYLPSRNAYHRATLERVADRGDLAVLSVPAEWPAAELADVPERGTPLTLWAFPKGVDEPERKTGRAMGFEGTILGLPAFMTSIRSEDGDSGGGQFDQKGRLCCLSITSAGSTVPVTAVKAILNKGK